MNKAMKKLLLTLMLAVVSSSAMAEWVEVGHANQQGVYINVYADPATIRKSGNTVKMWSVYDYLEAKNNPNLPTFRSIKRQEEYDCKEEKKKMSYV